MTSIGIVRGGRTALRPLGALLGGLLLLAGPLLAWHHGRGDSATADEPHHLLAGYQMVRLGDFAFNLEHPPLAKDLAGLSLLSVPLRPISDGWKRLDYAGNVFEAFLYGNSSPSSVILERARAPFPVVLLAVELLVLASVRALGAPSLALPSALLVGLDPNFVAHAAWVHTDVPASFAFLSAIAVGAGLLRRPTLLRAAGAGCVLGLALATKFSAVWLVPMLLAAATASLTTAARRGGARASRRLAPSPGRIAGATATALVVAFGLLAGIYRWNLRGTTGEARAAVVARHLSIRGASPRTVTAFARLGAISPELAHWGAGLAGVALQGGAGQGVNFLAGEKRRTGWPTYFLHAFVWKTPLPLLVLLPAGAFLAVRGRRASPVPFALLLCAAAYALASAPAAYNIGVRHLLPVYPLLVVAGAGAAGAAAAGSAIRLRAAAATTWGATLLVLVSTVGIHPHEVSYFNLLAGGPSRGADLLTDSNVDWGQDLGRLRAWAAREAPKERLSVAYFGGASVRFEIPSAHDLTFEPADAPLPAGLYAVSEFLLRVGPEFYLSSSGDPVAAALSSRLNAAIRDRGEPVARIGYSIHVFRLRPEWPPPGGAARGSPVPLPGRPELPSQRDEGGPPSLQTS